MSADDPDGVILSDEERRILAEIEARLSGGDQALACRLTPCRHPSGDAVFAVAAIVSGLLTILVTFTTVLWGALIGVGLTGVGLGLGLRDIAARVARARHAWGGPTAPSRPSPGK